MWQGLKVILKSSIQRKYFPLNMLSISEVKMKVKWVSFLFFRIFTEFYCRNKENKQAAWWNQTEVLN